MIKIDFGENGGGVRSFKNLDGVVQYFELQGNEWKEHPLWPQMADSLGTLASVWIEIKNDLINNRQQTQDLSALITDFIENSHLTRRLVRVDSSAGQAIIRVMEDLGIQAALGALNYLEAEPRTPIFNNMMKRYVEGALAFRDHVNRVSTASSQASKAAFTKLAKDLQDEAATHRQELEGFEESHRGRIEQLNRSFESEQSQWSEWVAEAKKALAVNQQRWNANWLELYDAYTEKLALEAPVELWTKRATLHEKKAGTLRLWVAGIGIGGVILALGFGASALIFGHWLLSGFGGASDVLSPTELLFAASATLIYLTLYFWTMRIVVRMYMTEHHLAIDAQSRSAMAQTYLALTKEKAATDQDRAIVLASLFRPVVDGIVKDDGLPAITPAAILAGLAGGKHPN